MAPHCEELIGYKVDLGDTAAGGIWEPVPGTQHFSEDDTGNAKKSHKLAQTDPFKYREVADEAGAVCAGFTHSELLDKLPTE